VSQIEGCGTLICRQRGWDALLGVKTADAGMAGAITSAHPCYNNVAQKVEDVMKLM
jgi:hypothetical protein